jgi:HEAT repeat protein
MILNVMMMTLWAAAIEPAGQKRDVAPLEAESPGTRDRSAEEADAENQAQDAEARLEDLYNAAHDQLDEGHWEEAVRGFDEIIREKGARADAALYWKAYAANKRGQRAESLATLGELFRAFPKSQWLSDGKALEAEVRSGAGQVPQPEAQANDEERLIVINSLLQSDPTRALPMLEKILSGTQSPKVKERALFVLCQTSSPQAREVVARIARSGAPDLQRKAIQYLGLFGGTESKQILSDIYASATDVAVKKTILRSFMTSGERGRLLSAAKTEPSPELRRDAIQQLGLLGAQAEIWDMYQAETSKDARKAMIQALFLGGSSDKMVDLARTEKDPELRRVAVRNLGLMGGPRAAQALVSLYTGEAEPGVRRDVIEALFLSGDAKALVELGRKEKDPALRKEIVTKLSLMGSKDATDFLLEILNK